MTKEMHPTCLRGLKDAHSVFCSVTLIVNVTSPQGTFLIRHLILLLLCDHCFAGINDSEQIVTKS